MKAPPASGTPSPKRPPSPPHKCGNPGPNCTNEPLPAGTYDEGDVTVNLEYCSGGDPQCLQHIEDVQKQAQTQLENGPEAGLQGCAGPECIKYYRSQIAAGAWQAVPQPDGSIEYAGNSRIVRITPNPQPQPESYTDDVKAACPVMTITQCAEGLVGAKIADWGKSALSSWLKFDRMDPMQKANAIGDGFKDWAFQLAMEDDFQREDDIINTFIPIDDLATNIIDGAKAAAHGDWVDALDHGIDAAGDTLLIQSAFVPGLEELGALGALGHGLEALDLLDAAAARAATTGIEDGGGLGSRLADLGTDCVKFNSFDPTTPVLMADGTTRHIKDIKTGDHVTATDPTTGQTTSKPVPQLHTNLDTDLTDLTLIPAHGATLHHLLTRTTGQTQDTAVLHTTGHHPFWDATTHQWTPASQLKPGHQLTGPNNQRITVTAVHNYTGAKTCTTSPSPTSTRTM